MRLKGSQNFIAPRNPRIVETPQNPPFIAQAKERNSLSHVSFNFSPKHVYRELHLRTSPPPSYISRISSHNTARLTADFLVLFCYIPVELSPIAFLASLFFFVLDALEDTFCRFFLKLRKKKTKCDSGFR